MQKFFNDTITKKNPVIICVLLHLCTTILKVDWPMIVNVQGSKEAKRKQIAIKLHFQIVRKWGIKSCFCYKVVVKLFCFLECRLSEEASKLG